MQTVEPPVHEHAKVRLFTHVNPGNPLGIGRVSKDHSACDLLLVRESAGDGLRACVDHCGAMHSDDGDCNVAAQASVAVALLVLGI